MSKFAQQGLTFVSSYENHRNAFQQRSESYENSSCYTDEYWVVLHWADHRWRDEIIGGEDYGIRLKNIQKRKIERSPGGEVKYYW